MKPSKQPIQFFDESYLKRCRNISPKKIVEFLEDYRTLHLAPQKYRPKSKLISIKIPQDLLETFKFKAGQEGIPYQTMIKKLMLAWVVSDKQDKE